MLKNRILPLFLIVVCIFGPLTGCSININLADSSDMDKSKTEDNTIFDDFSGRRKVYESRATVYISNTSTAESPIISSSDLSTSMHLAETCAVILNTSPIQNKIKEKYPNIDYELRLEQINETEIFAVIATGENPKDLEEICNMAISLLCEQIPNIVDGVNCKIVNYAKSTQEILAN